jgi:ftsJ-like methyltransferase
MAAKGRLDKELVARGLVASRSQAENYIRLGDVLVDGKVVQKPGYMVGEQSLITLSPRERYVSRAGLKLASVASVLGITFTGRIVLDVGSSTGGFTDYALKHGAKKVYAVDVGTDQLHPDLRRDSRIELHEKTDIRDFVPNEAPDIVLIDVSFISLRQILPHLASICKDTTLILAMVKPQFEAARQQLGNSGVIKNDTIRRQILRDFEAWSAKLFVTVDKADSAVAGARGNRERFYALKVAKSARR